MPISAYLGGLRQKVGTDLLLMPAVTVVCRDEQRRILLVKHQDYAQWALPGGAIDPGETPSVAAARELWEETGLWVEPIHVLGVYGGPAYCVTYPNGDQIASVDTVFDARVIGGQLAADQDEISEVRYFTPAEVAALPLPPWMNTMLPQLLSASNRTYFQPAAWTPPADGIRKGGASAYIRDLRRRIGHELLLLPAVFALVFDEEGRVLLQQRADNGRWSAPGGGMDPYETPSDAAVREVWEETGMLVEPVAVLGVYGGSSFRATHLNGDQTASVVTVFVCRVVAGQPTPDGIESLAVKFVPVAEAQTMLSARWQRRLAQALAAPASAYFVPSTWLPPR